ncbi:hypothetical protein MtrunA17_Chr2g0282331 [Medicago truncatula]|uniref:Uncharacterized protein n=1 Tax=Medicago truncatula TaxID=3880 RepID=A0A396J5X7_MEDTR|nr:hypothetical protein MtrunA17_Chr2g0282331 [Medicago truncatula]
MVLMLCAVRGGEGGGWQRWCYRGGGGAVLYGTISPQPLKSHSSMLTSMLKTAFCFCFLSNVHLSLFLLPHSQHSIYCLYVYADLDCFVKENSEKMNLRCLNLWVLELKFSKIQNLIYGIFGES